MLEIKTENQTLVCAFKGRFDTVNTAKIEEELIAKILSSTIPVVFDLKDTEYVCSSFLQLCTKAAQALGAEKFSIINVSPDILRVFKIAGFDKIISIK